MTIVWFMFDSTRKGHFYAVEHKDHKIELQKIEIDIFAEDRNSSKNWQKIEIDVKRKIPNISRFFKTFDLQKKFPINSKNNLKL
jgi:hypothetical protein